jgi:glycosyltransferase involved in cell wall biosynthesis
VNRVHVVVPDGIDDPLRPSGGNAYDRRVCAGLAAAGWGVREHPVPGTWPDPSPTDEAALAGVVTALPDGATVVVDGLIASAAAAVLVPHAARVRLVVLVHMPLDGGAGERAVLATAAAVITTSASTRDRLARRYALAPSTMHVAAPGVDPADLATGTAGGGALLCVGAVSPHKGHDVLIGALAALADRAWRCAVVGPLDRDAEFVARLRRQAAAGGIDERIDFTGPRAGTDLDRAYAGADALVLASRAETYGMVVTEALARGLPVLASDVGGVPEALGHTADGRRPGLLVPPGDPDALADAVGSWLGRADLRARLRQAARDRRGDLTGWSVTTARVARVLAQVAA